LDATPLVIAVWWTQRWWGNCTVSHYAARSWHFRLEICLWALDGRWVVSQDFDYKVIRRHVKSQDQRNPSVVKIDDCRAQIPYYSWHPSAAFLRMTAGK
jgi:hypothetical protein